VPDFTKLYASLHTTWDKVRVDILSHVFLLALLFLAGVTRPPLLSAVNVDRVMNLPIYKLAKDTNAFVLVPIALTLIILAYGILMRAIGQALSTAVLALFLPMSRHWLVVSPVSVSDLVTLASLQTRSDFEETDLSETLTILAVRYTASQRGKKPELDFTSGDRDASLYLNYALLFSVCWIALFVLVPTGSEWQMRNTRAFWPVLLALIAFTVRSWIQMRVFFRMMPGSLIMSLAFKARSDPEQAQVLAAAQPRLSAIETRIDELRLRALRQAAAPSLLGFIGSKLGGVRHADKNAPSNSNRFWLRRFYDEGREFSESEEKAGYEDRWLPRFGKYVFYRAVRTITRLGLLAGGLLIYVAGVSGWISLALADARERQRLELGKKIDKSDSAVMVEAERILSQVASRDRRDVRRPG
jgi:hypothetical protein